jgi:hypothetical protein
MTACEHTCQVILQSVSARTEVVVVGQAATEGFIVVAPHEEQNAIDFIEANVIARWDSQTHATRKPNSEVAANTRTSLYAR